MPSLQAYSRDLPYAYAPGIFPAMECLNKRPDTARRILYHSRALASEGVRALIERGAALGVRAEMADRALARVSGKENCFAAVVFDKFEGELADGRPHIVLHNPADQGNLGTILRTALGFGFLDIAVVRPAADCFDPHVVRASMGAIFGLSVRYFDAFDAYRARHPAHALYPFMLDGACPLAMAAGAPKTPYALVFGNEGSGLPAAFAALGQAVRIPHGEAIDSLNLSAAAAIGMYAFREGNNAANHASAD